MLIHELEKFDTVICEVEACTKENGIYLKIKDLEGTATVKAYNWCGKVGDKVMASVIKVAADNNFIKLSVDAVLAA